jgi:hypothetical protein
VCGALLSSSSADAQAQVQASKTPGPLETLQGLVREADALSIRASVADAGDVGAPDVSAIRRRLAKLDAIRAEASGSLHTGPASIRTRARLLVAQAHENFARALDVLPPLPETAAIDAETRAAWLGQRELTLRNARLRAMAYARSCNTLPGAPKADVRACAELLRSIPRPDARQMPTGAPKTIVELRTSELSVCVSEASQRTRDVLPEHLLARLDIDKSGQVSDVALEGQLGSEALKACLEHSLRLWAFPGLFNVAIELPIRLRVRME